MSRSGGERGSGSVWVAALAGVLALVGGAAVLVGAAGVARHRAESAADLAALGAARSAVMGDPAACAVARSVAGRNGARVTGCRLRPGGVVEVTVSVPVRLGGLGTREATARARAGPV